MKVSAVFLSIFFTVVLPICSTCLGQCPSSDFTHDCKVDFDDYAIFASQWSGDWEGLSFFASEWLYEGSLDDPYNMVWVYINDINFDEQGNELIDQENFVGQMSKYETTNAQYCRFLNDALTSGDIYVIGSKVYGANGLNNAADFVNEVYYNLSGPGFTSDNITNGGACRISYNDQAFVVDIGFEDHPVTYVSWYGAAAFANYYGWRLPTNKEWASAADYDGSYIYGCGTNINNTMANYCETIHPDGTIAVGSFDSYGYGLCDMAGNVLEWTSSSYLSDEFRISCGGGWDASVRKCQACFTLISTKRFYHNTIGFRVCR